MTSSERAFQSIFYMGAFFAAMEIEPRCVKPCLRKVILAANHHYRLSPEPGREVKYESTGEGMRIEAR